MFQRQTRVCSMTPRKHWSQTSSPEPDAAPVVRGLCAGAGGRQDTEQRSVGSPRAEQAGPAGGLCFPVYPDLGLGLATGNNGRVIGGPSRGDFRGSPA